MSKKPDPIESLADAVLSREEMADLHQEVTGVVHLDSEVQLASHYSQPDHVRVALQALEFRAQGVINVVRELQQKQGWLP